MSNVGQLERATQNRVIQLFSDTLGYTYLGNWANRTPNRNIEPQLLTPWLTQQNTSPTLITKTLRQLDQTAALNDGTNLYDINKAVYRLLRYGIKVKPGTGEQTQTIWLIDWQNPENNHFAIAEEVTIQGNHTKRPDLVLYINGIALAVLELKSSRNDLSKGIRQNIDNQNKTFIRPFFTTLQLVMAGNDTQGLRYGTIETREKYYLNWKEENPQYNPQTDPKTQKYLPPTEPPHNLLDTALLRLCNKTRLLELIHDFTVFDTGTKKNCRHNQYFGIKAAQQHIQRRQDGIIWHTQGSGKSLTMVWLAKWIREHITDARVLIITDRTELDEQIEKVFQGVDEDIYRTRSGTDLLATLDRPNPWLLCSLVHKFSSSARSSDQAADQFIQDLKAQLTTNFQPKGNLFIFVDECHRTQSGKLHTAMKAILPNALFIGFTGTPLLQQDKQTSIEIFGGYIHTYKFDEAVADGVVLDLRYEARDIDQHLTSSAKVDQWFEAKTSGLSPIAKTQLKQKWGTMQKVLSSQSRLHQIVKDILLDMDTKPRLMDGRGNAMLVCNGIYQACKIYDLFSQTDLKGKCAIITSYKPSPNDIKGEDSGEGLTEKLKQYDIYRRMLADYFSEPEDKAMYRVEEFETKVKERFIKEPGQIRLLIVVDKLLTGFDAPPATYLYIDKPMRDHALFQAICRVNRLDGEDKEYGYIVDYKDLFNRLEGAITHYTGGALNGYAPEDVAGLLVDRLDKACDRLEATRETLKALCEPVLLPRNTQDYLHYFCGPDTTDPAALATHEPKRVALYQAVAALLRAYASLANEMTEAGYGPTETATIQTEVEQAVKMRDEVKIASGDYLDMKRYEPAMRHLLDSYIRADESTIVSEFGQMGLVQLIVQNGLSILDQLPAGLKQNPATMAETIEHNLRKTIIDENPVNPKYYDQMSALLDALIQERRQQAITYQDYLEKVKQLAQQIVQPTRTAQYPIALDTPAKRSLYDNLDQNEALTLRIDTAVRQTKREGWVGKRLKEREVKYAIQEAATDCSIDLEQVLELVKNQHEYR